MAGSEGVLSRASLVNQEWARELDRKESLEKRGITVITTSGVLVTLIFAFSGAVAKGHHFGNFTLAEKILIAIALAFFLFSGVFGIATNTPRTFAALRPETLRGRSDQAAPQDPITEETLDQLIEALRTSRLRNDTKARALALAIVLQVIAVLVIGVTIMIVII